MAIPRSCSWAIQETLERIKDAGARLYRTDMQGAIKCISDGKTVSIEAERSPGEDTFAYAGGYKNALEEERSSADKEAAAVQTEEISSRDGGTEDAVQNNTTAQIHYIVNTNTGKFHFPSCKSVKHMKDKNKMDFTGTRDELISMGYAPCQNCGP